MRNKAFWFLDKLKRGGLSRELEEVSSMILHPDLEINVKKKKIHLNNLLNHAVKSTSFYKSYKDFNSIQDFPISNKNVIRNNYQAFSSENFDFSKLNLVSTSGSTGMPFKVHHSLEKRRRNHADTLFFQNYGGYKVGDPLSFLRVWNEINKKSALHHFKYNTYPIDISDLSDESIEKIISKINKLPDKSVLLAYGSTIEILADYIMKNNVKISLQPKCCFIMSEPIHIKVRKFMSDHLQCPVLIRYSNSENGFLGHQWNMETDDYLINTASYFIELLDFEKDESVKEGEPGRIVVTDLFNYAVPMIRYDTGDIAVKGTSKIEGNEVPVFISVEGRRLDFIHNTSGELISPHTIDYGVRQTPGLIQFQLIQIEKKKYILKLLLSDRKNVLENTVRENLNRYLGSDAIIEIEYVSEIPVLSSGKRKIVVNQINT